MLQIMNGTPCHPHFVYARFPKQVWDPLCIHACEPCFQRDAKQTQQQSSLVPREPAPFQAAEEYGVVAARHPDRARLAAVAVPNVILVSCHEASAALARIFHGAEGALHVDLWRLGLDRDAIAETVAIKGDLEALHAARRGSAASSPQRKEVHPVGAHIFNQRSGFQRQAQAVGHFAVELWGWDTGYGEL